MSRPLVDYASSSSEEDGSDSRSDSSDSRRNRDYCEPAQGNKFAENSSNRDQWAANNEGGGRKADRMGGTEDAGHVRGGWAGHVSLEVSDRSRQQLRAVGQACVAAAAGRGRQMEAIAAPHVSLTRVFYLQEHQIVPFVQQLEASIQGMGEFAVGFAGLSTYTNERGDREFVAVDVETGSEAVGQVVARVDRVMERFGRARFFADARFHASVARGEAGAGDTADQMRGAGVDEEILRLPAARIDTLQCTVGNRLFSIAL
ncbi:poly(U)-specific 3'-to-5' RNA exonuclease [Coemansia sp. RSA 552]|nr:poly(U)-specific 3'-to-5' RNA exonuclease [Coemansia sp. RSA 552]